VKPDKKELEQQAKQAMDLYRKGQAAQAVEIFLELQAAYQEQGNLVKADEMANNLAVALLELDQADRAVSLVENTPERFLSADEPLLAAQAYGNLGAALAAGGRTDEAEQAYRQSLKIFQEQGHDEGMTFAGQAMSQLQLKQGRALEALASMEASLEGQKKPGLRQRLMRKLLKLPFRLTGGR
jgi:tetratricopeptide (TPR) repeat protein